MQVADFGLAKLSNDTHTHVSTRIMGTFGYLAPEYASSGKLTDRSDVFSFGVVLLEVITGRKPDDQDRPLGEESHAEWVPTTTSFLACSSTYWSLTQVTAHNCSVVLFLHAGSADPRRRHRDRQPRRAGRPAAGRQIQQGRDGEDGGGRRRVHPPLGSQASPDGAGKCVSRIFEWNNELVVTTTEIFMARIKECGSTGR